VKVDAEVYPKAMGEKVIIDFQVKIIVVLTLYTRKETDSPFNLKLYRIKEKNSTFEVSEMTN